MSEIIVDKDNEIYDSRDFCNAIIETDTDKIIVGCQNTKIPDSVIEIGNGCFADCLGLKGVNISDSIVGIGLSAFRNCVNLAAITVSNGNKVYDSRGNCNAIIKSETNKLIVGCNSTIIQNSVETIGSFAFDGVSPVNIVIPESVKRIADFAFCNCKDLKTIYFHGSSTKFAKHAFCNCISLESIYVPSGLTDFYKKQLPKSQQKLVKEF